MAIEINPEDSQVVDNSADIHGGLEPDSGFIRDPSPEHNAVPDTESEPASGPVPDVENVPRGAQLRAELSRILSMVSERESLGHYWQDPKNDYAKYRRIQLQSRLSAELEKLLRYKPYLDKEVERCVRNLERIRSDLQKLNLTEPMEYYLEAERLQQIQYYEAVCDREAVYWTLKRVQAALGSSGIGGFAVRDPFTPNVPIYSPSREPEIHPGGLGEEVDGLLSLGPLDKNSRQR
ncbi:MAG: hypothetical protein AMJ75_02580 [Phycisphaerae bacterium SM1_79]|nr:MAG: hypothetical protein AMJ75_02580 [Phycisphaerae bacterium SM1_79]